MKTRELLPLEDLFFEWYFDEVAENSFYNNNAYCSVPHQGDFWYPDSDYCSYNCNNNSNITRRKRGRQTTFHKVGGQLCLRLDLSSLERDDEVVALSPPLLSRAPPSGSLIPSPPRVTYTPETVENSALEMGSGASNAKSAGIKVTVSPQAEKSDSVATVTSSEMVTVTEENFRPLMPSRNEQFISISGGARRLEPTESMNNNAASSSQKKQNGSTKSIQHSSSSGVSVSDINSQTLNVSAKLSECTCMPSSNQKEPTKPPTCDNYSSLQAIFNVEGREIDYVQGDGNCFFRALSKEIYGSEDSHYELRQAIVDLMARHRNEFEQFTDTGTQSFGSHLYEMRQYAVWATTAEIYGASTLLQRDIYVFSPDYTGTDYSWLLFSPCFPRQLDSTTACPQCYVTLCHTNGNHYDKVTPLEGWCNCALPPPKLSGLTKSVSVTSDNSSASFYHLKDSADNRLDRKNTPGE